MPELRNTDGELLEFNQAHFKLMLSPEEALAALLPLTQSKNSEEFLMDAKRDKSGNIKEILIPWLKKGNKLHKEWENTMMGNITIQPGHLLAETNSAKRANKRMPLKIPSKK